MPDQKEKIQIPDRNARPEGFWSLPGGLDGISGSVDGVNKAIDALEKVPAHDKTAMKEKIKATLEGTDFNFVKILSRESSKKTEECVHVNGHYDIWVSKKHI